MRRIGSPGILALFLAAVAVTACSSDPWLDEANPSRNHFFDLRLAQEIRAFWYVSASQFDVASQMLRTRPFVAISPEQATPLIGRVPDAAAGESLFLIRAIDVADPTRIRVYQIGSWVEVSAGTSSTCFIVGPPIRRQPLVVSLPRAPTRLRLGYACAG
jgi:hypothetical protein